MKNRRVERELMWVERPAGSKLSKSRKNPGAFSPLARDEKELITHVTLTPYEPEDDDTPLTTHSAATVEPDTDSNEDDEESPLEQLVGALITLGVTIGGAYATAHVKNWRANRKARREATTDPPPPAVSLPVEPDRDTTLPAEIVIEDPATGRVIMSSAEAEQRLLAALEARRFSEAQIGMLRSAEIRNDLAAELHQGPERGFSPVADGEPQALASGAPAVEELAPARFGNQSPAGKQVVADQREPQVLEAPLWSPPEANSTCESPAAPPLTAQLSTPSAAPPPGWHADPWRAAAYRYWDGTRWTHHISP